LGDRERRNGRSTFRDLPGATVLHLRVFVAMAHVLLVELPAFLVLRRIIAPGWLLSGACGFVFGAAPFWLIARINGTDGLGDVPITLSSAPWA
jgi:hypothetical protein